MQNKIYVTEAAVRLFNMTSETAQDEMIRQRAAKSGQNAIDQLRVIASLCNSGEFDAASSHLPLPERKINSDATDQAIPPWICL